MLWLLLAIDLGASWGFVMGLLFGFTLKLFIGAALFGIFVTTWIAWRMPADSKRGS